MKNKLYLSLLFVSIIFLSCNSTGKKESQMAGCPPDMLVSAGSFDTETWTYINKAAGFEFVLPEGWEFVTDVGGTIDFQNLVKVGEPFPDISFTSKNKPLDEIREISEEGNILGYFFIQKFTSGIEFPAMLHIGVSASDNGNAEADLSLLMEISKGQTRKIKQDIENMRQTSDDPASIPDYEFTSELKKDFPVGMEKWPYLDFRLGFEENIMLVKHLAKNVGCYNLIIRAQYYDDEQEELINSILKNNIKQLTSTGE